MNNLSAPSRTPKTYFNIAAEKAANFLKRTVESAKQFREYSIKEQLKAGVNLGVLPKGLMKKANNLTAALFNNLNLATIMASNNSGLNKAIQKQILEAFQRFSTRAAARTTRLNASASFNTVRVNSKLAELAANHVETHIAQAPLSAIEVLNKDPAFKIPWAENVASLKSQYEAGLIKENTATVALSEAILENNGIRDGLITAGGLNMLADKFNVPVKNKWAWKNSSIAVFNDNADLQVAKQSTSLKDLPNTLDKLFKNSVGSVANTLTQGLIPQVSLVPIPVAPQGQRFNPRGPSLLG